MCECREEQSCCVCSLPYCCDVPVGCDSGSPAAVLYGCFCWLHGYPRNSKVRCTVSSAQQAPAASCKRPAGLQLQASRLLLLYMPSCRARQQHDSCRKLSRSTLFMIYRLSELVRASNKKAGGYSDWDQRCRRLCCSGRDSIIAGNRIDLGFC